MLKGLRRRVYRWMDGLLPARGMQVMQGEVLPTKMPFRGLVLVRDGDENWCVGFKCPCGCDRTIELLLAEDVAPRWDCTVDASGRPSLHPSVWLNNGCKSHFWLRNGKVVWA
ncbi:DUF6527 family protein [Pseudomonas lutea]|uniref:DUF6527 family protein n=1 Tax=Pseudomonas lutea TaxID=243924 RepID=UPI0030B8D950